MGGGGAIPEGEGMRRDSRACAYLMRLRACAELGHYVLGFFFNEGPLCARKSHVASIFVLGL